jgi:SAM-dependent methyltransferase
MADGISFIKSNYTCLYHWFGWHALETKGVMVSPHKKDENLDQGVIDSFGHEWATFDYGETDTSEALDAQFRAYCTPLDLNQFDPKKSIAGDFGAGSGRWASRLIPYFSLVYALEPSDGASTVLKNKFSGEAKIVVLQESVGANSIPLESLDLAMSLGVLHHIPNVTKVLSEMIRVLKVGGVLLIREPIHSMGDWNSPRFGLTKNERGISEEFFNSFFLIRVITSWTKFMVGINTIFH